MNGRLLAVGDVAEVSEWALASKRGCKVSRVVVASERLRCLPHRVLGAAARAHLGRRLIFAQAFIDDLPQEIIAGPGSRRRCLGSAQTGR